MRIDSDSGDFKLGPYIPLTAIWNTDDLDRGPWPTAQAYVAALAERQLRYLNTNTSKYLERHKAQRGDGEHLNIGLVDLYYRLLLKLSAQIDASGSHPAILHVDLNPDNIMVDTNDHSRIVCIFDWDYAEVSPLWAY